MADPMTKDEAILWVKNKLGGGVIVLELDDEHFDDAFDDAVRWYVSKRGIQRRVITQLVSGVQEYEMVDDCDEVIQVDFPGAQMDIIAAVNPYAFIDIDQVPVAYQSMTGVPGGSFYGSLHQILAHAETARRIIGSEPAWQYMKDTNTIQTFPRTQRSGLMCVTYISTRLGSTDPVFPATTPKNDFRKLRFRERDLILKMAVAQAKMRLGRVRGKYMDGMPSAGGSKPMDGDTLLTEGLAEIEALDQELMGLSDPVPFLVG